MAEQRTFAGLAWSTKGKITRREHFLSEMKARAYSAFALANLYIVRKKLMTRGAKCAL